MTLRGFPAITALIVLLAVSAMTLSCGRKKNNIAILSPGQMVERLAERKVYVDWRPGAGLRVSPHFFNTDEEVEEALNTLAELME